MQIAERIQRNYPLNGICGRVVFSSSICVARNDKKLRHESRARAHSAAKTFHVGK
jgi:hypothetical protein